MGLRTRCWALFLSTFVLTFSTYATNQSSRPVFTNKKIVINKIVLSVEVAESQEQQSYGLMYLTKLPKNSGMLFVFKSPEVRSFWMKNTYIDLSIGYFDQNKILFQITDMTAASLMQKNFPSYVSSGPALFALEVPKGWFNKNDIKLGDKFDWR